MKRDRGLVPLSRDHHRALVAAQRLRRATEESASYARALLLNYWIAHGRWHFRVEEEVLLPAYAAHGDPYHPLVARALCDHVVIRQAVNDLDDAEPSAAKLHQLGVQLADHVRFEERELFPMIEQVLREHELAALRGSLERVERQLASG